jgi:hemerythrin
MTIIWKNSMTVGSKVIDNEHKYLFSLVNCVLLALRVGDCKEINIFIDQLIEYADEHFKHEEKLQIAISYPGYYENKKQHQLILENLQLLKERLHKLSNTSKDGQLTEESIEEKIQADGSAELIITPEKKNAPPENLVEEISQLLRHWILEHVLTVDRKMQRYVTNLPHNKRSV